MIKKKLLQNGRGKDQSKVNKKRSRLKKDLIDRGQIERKFEI